MIRTLRHVSPLLAIVAAQVLFLANGAMLGCSFKSAQGNVDDNMDEQNFYTCGCRCSTTAPQNVRVSAAFDDAEAALRTDDTDGAGDLDLGVVLAGVRFANIAIPPGAGILSAAVQFSADQGFAGDNTTPLTLEVYAAAVDNAPSFGGNFVNLGALPHSATSVGWPVPPWALQQSGPAQRTPNLSSLIQEVVSRPGWKSGNAIAMLFGAGGGRREAESFDGNSTRAAVLEIQFVVYADQALNVCAPPGLNPNFLDANGNDQPIPTDAQLQADCAGRVQDTLGGLAMECGYPAQCDCDLVADSRKFNAECNEPCTEVPVDADCTNFDPMNGSVTATNAPGDVPVCVAARRTSAGTAPAALAAAAFGQESECQVEGTATVDFADESKETDTFGTVGIRGRPCPGAQCTVGVSYDLGLDPITFEVRFASDPTFEDLAASGANTAGVAMVGPAGLGAFGAQALQNTVRGRRSSDTRAFVLDNPAPVGVFVDWEEHVCGLFGEVASTVDDDGDQALAAEVSVTGQIANEPPHADAGEDQELECTSPDGATVLLDGRASGDPEDNAVLFSWSKDDRVGESAGFGTVVERQQALGAPTTYFLRVIDAFGQSDEDASSVEVVDTTAPQLSLSVAPAVLWPPNHQLVTVTVTVTSADACDPNPTIRLVSIASNEGDLANGSGHTSPDIQNAEFGTDDRVFSLRSERRGSGTTRIYTITYEVEDADGNVTVAQATVRAPQGL